MPMNIVKHELMFSFTRDP